MDRNSTSDSRNAFNKDDLIKDLKNEVNFLAKKIKQYKCSEEAFEVGMDEVEGQNRHLRRELDKTKKEMLEAKDTLNQFENLENLEIDQLEIKENIANGIIEKLKNDVIELEHVRRENKKIEIEVKNLEKENQVSNEELKKKNIELKEKLLRAVALEKDKEKDIDELRNFHERKEKKIMQKNYMISRKKMNALLRVILKSRNSF